MGHLVITKEEENDDNFFFTLHTDGWRDESRMGEKVLNGWLLLNKRK